MTMANIDACCVVKLQKLQRELLHDENMYWVWLAELYLTQLVSYYFNVFYLLIPNYRVTLNLTAYSEIYDGLQVAAEIVYSHLITA